jgi:hypothetical protein
MKKNVDDFAIALMILGVDLGGLDEALEELWEKIPTKEGGKEVEKEAFMELGRKLWSNAKWEIQTLTGELPPVTEDDLNPPEEPEEFPGYTVFTTAKCDDWMSYRDSDHSESVKQRKCLFRDFSNCSQMPDRFTVVWIDAEGNQEFLEVSDKCGIAMGDINAGYRKYRWEDDKHPHPVAYAPRYFDAVECKVLVRK